MTYLFDSLTSAKENDSKKKELELSLSAWNYLTHPEFFKMKDQIKPLHLYVNCVL